MAIRATAYVFILYTICADSGGTDGDKSVDGAAAAASRNHPAPSPPKNRRRVAEPAEIISRRRNFYGAP